MKTRKLVYGAMIAALVGVVSLLNSYTGGAVDSLIGYFMVIPFAWYGAKYSLKDNMLVAVASVAIVLFTGIPSFLIIAIYSAVFGCFVGECIRRKTSKATMLIGGFLISFLVNMLEIEVFAGVLGINIMKDMTQTYHDMVNSFPAIKQTLSLNHFLNLIPLLILLMSMLECYVMLALCQITMYRLKIPFPGNLHIATFNMGAPFALFTLIVGGVCLYLMNHVNVPYNIDEYLFYGAELLFALQGMAYVAFLLLVHNHPKMTAILFILLFVPYGMQVYGILGIYDVFTAAKQRLYNKLS